MLIWYMHYGILIGKVEQKNSGWDKSNQEILGGINIFPVNICMGQSFEMDFYRKKG